MKRPSRKTLLCAGLLLLLLAAALIYLRPLPLLDGLAPDAGMFVTTTQLGVRDGLPFVDTQSYEELTPAQREEIAALLTGYRCRRTLATLFAPDAADMDERTVSLFVYENGRSVRSIVLGETGTVTIDGRAYALPDAPALMDSLLWMLEEE